jgi:hypothetical protein
MKRVLIGPACLLGLVVHSLTLAADKPLAGPALAQQIQAHVERGVQPARDAMVQAQAAAKPLDAFRHLVRTDTWTEQWPDAQGTAQTRSVTGQLWRAAIQATLEQQNTAFIPARAEPYYLDGPLVLRSGQSLVAEARAEIRLKPGVNTCMVRNAHPLSFQDGPVPQGVEPDRNLYVAGGIWTTLGTGPRMWNGNTRGRASAADDVPGCHGVVLLSNVCGAVVRNVTVRQSLAFGVHVSNSREFLVEGVTFENHGRDGVHVNGPSAYGLIRNVRGVTHDDFVALNAWEWQGYTPTFGAIDHVLVEDVVGTNRATRDYASPYPDGTAELRLLPGVKRFAGGTRVECSIHDCVFRKLTDLRTVKLYDQPNLELGRDKDFSDTIGTVRNLYFSQLVYNRPGRFQIAANVEGLTIEDVQLAFQWPAEFRLVEIGPMSATYRRRPADPSTWTEIFSPDRDVTVRGCSLRGVQVLDHGQMVPLADADRQLVRVADQRLNPDYPRTTPRGGTGRARLIP